MSTNDSNSLFEDSGHAIEILSEANILFGESILSGLLLNFSAGDHLTRHSDTVIGAMAVMVFVKET